MTVSVCPAIATLPVRGDCSVFTPTVIFTVPLPVPAVGETPSQIALDVALQPQLPPLTVTANDSPVAGDVRVAGEMVNAQLLDAACVTVKSWPAMLIVPLRCAPGFGATTTFTAPEPVPVLAPLNVSHAALLNDIHAQADPVVTETVVVSPAAGELRTVGERPKVQAVLAAWVTENVWPAMVMVPVRWAPVLPATTTVTAPLPVPVAPDVTISQLTLLAAFHAHALVVVTATLVVSPIDGALCVVGEIE